MDEDEDQGRAGRERRGGHRRPQPLLVSVTALAAIGMLTLTVIAHFSPARAGAGARPAAGTSTAGTSAAGTGARTGAAHASAAPSPARTSPAPSPAARAAGATTPSATATPSARSSPASRHGIADAVSALADSAAGDLAVAVADADGGAAASYDSTYDSTYDSGTRDTDGAGGTYDTASIVKVDILAALLLDAQDAGTRLTSRERELATAMIERSDNDAATALWHTIGGGAGLDAANDRLGLDRTTGGSGELWGLTRTTAQDQVALLRAVFGQDSALSAASRAYISGLMGSVVPGQRWGVSAADSDDTGFALKNGWLRRSATGLWDVNSIGLVTYEGHRLLISVLSRGRPSEAAGIDLVEDVARAAAEAFTAAG